MNQVKSHLQTLGLLDRALQLADDDTLVALVAALDEEHTDALTEVAGPDHDADHLRDAISRGRLDGRMEAIAALLGSACRVDCVERLGDSADHPSSDELRAVLPGLIEKHGLDCTRIMLAQALTEPGLPAAAIIRDILKTDEVLALPPSEERSIIPERRDTATDDAEREELKARRREAKARKQAEAAARREQAARAKRR